MTSKCGLAATALVIAALCRAAAGDSFSSTAATAFAVDSRAGGRRVAGSVEVGYSPAWCGSEDGSYVVVYKVAHAGMFNAETNVVATLPANGEGTLAFSPDEGDEPCVRLVHRVFSAAGEATGSALEADFAFGFNSDGTAPLAVDNRATSLQEAMRDGRPLLAYDTSWATNAASLTISKTAISGRGGDAVSTTPFFAARAEDSGSTPARCASRGWWRLECRIADAGGDTLVRYLSPEFWLPGGTVFSVK